jgi:uncharacterized protein involved in exopolysaccharide biosynthesis
MEDEIDLREYIAVIAKRWRIIIFIGIIAAIIDLYQGGSQPKLYKATATIMPTDSGGGGLGSALSLFGSAGSAGEGKLVPILKSRALAKEVVKIIDINFINHTLANDTQFSAENKIQLLAGELQGALEAKTGTSGLLEITATWKDPKIAAEVANKYVGALGRFLNSRALNINYQLIDPALPPGAPFNKKTRQTTFVSLLIGLFSGTVLAFFLEYWKKIKKQI